MASNIATTDYKEWLIELKNQFRQTQLKATIKINTALLEFYWLLGSEIVEKQKLSAWGDGFLRQLSCDLNAEFPTMKGFSLNNLQYIKRWHLFYSAINKSGTACSTIAQQPIAQLIQIPWGHNLKIISKCSNIEEALFYVNNTQQYGWSRAVLILQIESGLWQREGKSVTNFENTLPIIQSDLAKQTLKDPYIFDFLSLTNDDIAGIAQTYHAWRGEKKVGNYVDKAGYCKSATLEDIKTNDYVLTPGRYVGAAEIKDDGIPFETKMTELSITLFSQMKKSQELDAAILGETKN